MEAGSGGCQLVSWLEAGARDGRDDGDRASLWAEVAGEDARDGVPKPLAVHGTLIASDGGGHLEGLVDSAGQEEMIESGCRDIPVSHPSRSSWCQGRGGRPRSWDGTGWGGPGFSGVRWVPCQWCWARPCRWLCRWRHLGRRGRYLVDIQHTGQGGRTSGWSLGISQAEGYNTAP